VGAEERWEPVILGEDVVENVDAIDDEVGAIGIEASLLKAKSVC
jgi:hypothetical protein